MRSRLQFVCLALCAPALLLAGCSSDDTSGKDPSKNPDQQTYLGLSTPADGFQVRDVGTTIPAGKELEFCEVAELPGDPSKTYYVKSMEFGNGTSSHHLIVTAAIPGGPADAKLRAMNIGDRVPCLSAQLAFGEAGLEGVGGIQQPYGRSDLPAGIGREFHGGQRVVFDYHYLNLSNVDAEARSAFNFHLGDPAEIKQIASGFGFYNFTIDTPAGKTGSFTGECHFKQDVKVGGITRHTHRWGTDYSVWFSGGAHDGEHIWTSKDWEHDIDHGFADPVLVKAGEGFRFQCDYDNGENHALRFGTSAKDEMCILFGLIWDAGGARETPGQDCQITWVDSNQIGHPANEAGGFPKATEGDAALCLSGAGGTATDCLKCDCNSCGSVLVKCATDADCKPILDCTRTHSVKDCQSVIDEHSSAAGLISQVSSCVSSQCSSVCGNQTAQ